MSTVSRHFEMSRFGSEVVGFSPRQRDFVIVAGTIYDKFAVAL
jgi:NADH-quinone oxidoreductase subunit B